jgi:radical SAM superfamily enzyme YgiQ (UPF0313 family)
LKVLIAYPPIESGKGVPLLSQNRQFQWFNNPTYIYPMVPSCAATLLQSKGYDVCWKDGIAEKNSAEDFLRYFAEIKPDVIAIETKTPVVTFHWKIIDDLKERLPSCRVVLFGDHVTALPQESFDNSKVDYILTGGNYDFLLLSLCGYLSKGAALESGIWLRENGAVRNTGPFNLDHDLNTLPLIDRDLTKWWLYSQENGNYKRLPGTYTMAGRDCWYHKCTFCSWTTIYPKYSVRTAKSLLDEIGTLIEKYGVKEVMDDTGTFPVGPWLKEFCEGMIDRGYNKRVILDCNMRFGALSLEEYSLMRKAGFRFMLFGLESANQKTLDRVNKGGSTKEKIIESCRLASKAGLSPHITIMFGYPWETFEDVMETVKLGCYLMKKGYAHTLQSTIVIPYPGTPLFDECKKNGWLKTTDWSRYDMREPIMKTPMPDEQLMEAVQAVYKVAFDPEFIFRKLIAIRDADDLKFIYRGAKAVWGHLTDFGGKKKCACEK